MKNLLLIVLALAAIAGGVWKFYIVPQQEKENAKIAAAEKAKAEAQAKEDAINAEEQKKKELAAKAEADAKAKALADADAEKAKAQAADQANAQKSTILSQKQDELKKLKAEANVYSLALTDWDKKNPQDVAAIKEYQDRAIKARDAMIESAKVIESKKQALTLAQNEVKSAAGQMRTGRTAKDAKGWRYMSEPQGTCHKLPVPTKNTKGPTMLVYPKDTRNEDEAAANQKKVDAINKELATAQTQYDSQKSELAKIKEDYKKALESKLSGFKPQIEKASQELAVKN